MSTSYKITDLTELAAVDVADADLLEIVDFDTDSSKKVSIQSLKTVFTASPAGSDTQIQFNDGGSFGASSNLTFDGEDILTLNATNNGHSTASTSGMHFGAGSNILRISHYYNFGIIAANGPVNIQTPFGLTISDTYNTSTGSKLHIINTTDQVGYRLDLSNGQTADAFQINSYGNTGGDLFKVTTNGGMVLNTSGTIVSGWSEGFNIGGSASATFRLSDTSTNKGFGMFFQNGFNYIARTTDNWSTLSYIGAFRDDRFGLGTINPNSSSIFEMSSTSKGFLPPRMTTTQRDAISSPATGLLIFNTTTVKLEYYSGSAWGQV